MALYRQGKAAMDANGIVTGTGTNWQSALTLIRPGATILFLSSPIQMAVVNKVVSDTQINAITTNGAVVTSSDYAILLSDSLTVDGLAQDVAETLRYYQSQETVIADAVDFFKDFDFEALQNLANQIKTDSEAAESSAAAAAASENAAKTSEANSKASEVAAETARDQVQQIINDAGEQSTLVVLAQPDGATKSGYGESTVGDTLDAPYVITGRVNIKNPYWNAPQDGAEDQTQEAATANAIAINRMLSSATSYVELDDLSRRVNAPLLIAKSLRIVGTGREKASLVWTGGDFPIIAQALYANKDAASYNNIILEHLRIVDQAASRVNNWAIDLTNGHSNSMSDCFIDFPAESTISDKYGVILGFARGSALLGTNVKTFVANFTNSRLVNGKLVMNTSDYYITHNELWGTGRDNAVELGFGGLVAHNEIVPGSNSGCYHFSDLGYNHDTMSYLGNYFDGNTSSGIFTGDGIKTDTVGLIDANIVANRFWFLNKGGINAAKMYGCNVTSNSFKDCDSDDTGETDIVCQDNYSNTIVNTHTRSANAPKTGAARTNLGSLWNLTGRLGFPPSILDASSNFSTAYASPTIVNSELFDMRGIGSRTNVTRTKDPSAANFTGKVVVVNGKIKISTGSAWVTINGTTGNITAAGSMDEIPDGDFRIPDPTILSNIPSGLTGSCWVETRTVADNNDYRMQRITKLSTGKVYSREKTVTWGSWSA